MAAVEVEQLSGGKAYPYARESSCCTNSVFFLQDGQARALVPEYVLGERRDGTMASATASGRPPEQPSDSKDGHREVRNLGDTRGDLGGSGVRSQVKRISHLLSTVLWAVQRIGAVCPSFSSVVRRGHFDPLWHVDCRRDGKLKEWNMSLKTVGCTQETSFGTVSLSRNFAPHTRKQEEEGFTGGPLQITQIVGFLEILTLFAGRQQTASTVPSVRREAVVCTLRDSAVKAAAPHSGASSLPECCQRVV